MADPSPSPNNGVAFGFQALNSTASQLNALSFVVAMMLGRTWTATLVQVKAVTNAGDVEPVGFVDVQPMVAQVDGIGNAVPHGVIYHLPYFRLQGGANAVILDPEVDDIGICIFASRDISAVKANKAPANPGSGRTFDPADGLYVGGVLNGAPTTYVQFVGDEIKVLSPTKVTVTAPNIQMNGDVDIAGKLHVSDKVTTDDTIVADGDVTGAGTHLHTHVHGGVQAGGADTGPPV